ncbi:ABC transporter ATP-binding protein [Roseibacterium sp. SDUM158017]|uniref:ABC transporter ATP-binding protein n=1 Tax=Roseicyclus salinarum TaxID=3036773 RepID=UPI0024150546|nr:ABC transporter ATP-binding protein [Roseibacterium sp. SDUM158017]MDG4647247.1 ABC transporter ATP-binding protein [Roseibacterium sp. SDUM158017]
MTALLEIRGLTKAYPGVVANDDVSFGIAPGEVHALLGENGAGKSTLVKMIYGLVRPDSGTMTLNGAPYAPAEPRAARASGVAMVFQHFSLFEALSVAENIALGMESPPKPRDLSRRIHEVSRAYGLPLDPGRMVGDLSAGERQRVEIIRCLLQDPKLLIMDEPTSVLTPQEVEILFHTLRKLSSEGTAILYISHKLEEIRTLCDAATILRLGKVVGSCVPAEVSAAGMAELMVGKSLSTPARAATAPGEVLLHVSGLSLEPASPFGTPLRHVGLEVRAGEVLGIGGVAGNGQDELLAALSGERPVAPGMIELRGQAIGATGPEARRRAGLLCAPEERLGHAAAPDMSLTENAVLTGRARRGLDRSGFVGWGKARAFAEEIIARFDVRTPGAGVAARALSGGNLQKFVIGREILQAPDVLVVNQPTWGVDASAAAAIRQALLDLASDGAAVIVISQDLDELLEISDRFCALNEGRLSAPRPARGLSMEEVGLMLGGAHDMHDLAGDGAATGRLAEAVP